AWLDRERVRGGFDTPSAGDENETVLPDCIECGGWPMAKVPQHGREAAVIALAALLAAGAWWGAGRLRRGNDLAATGGRAYQRGDWGEAAARARELLKTRPTDAGATRLLARSSARLGRDDAALALFERLGSGAWEAEDNLLMGRILARREQPD